MYSIEMRKGMVFHFQISQPSAWDMEEAQQIPGEFIQLILYPSIVLALNSTNEVDAQL